MLPYWVEVGTPTGKHVIPTDKVYRNCEIRIGNKSLPIDLIALPIRGYEIILGMDWLSRYYAQINCKTKDISFCIPGEPVLQHNFKNAPNQVEMISGEKAKKLLCKGAM